MTVYNGSANCPCGKALTPLESAYSGDGTCGPCRREKASHIVRNGMVDAPRRH